MARGDKAEPLGDERRKKLNDRLEAYMAKKGLRSTVQRRVIVDAFFAGPPHRTIEDLLAEVRTTDRHIGYATVYRTLKLLAEAGVASERRFTDGLSRYELADDDEEHHDHIICEDCGRIVEFEEPRIEELQEGVAKRLGFRIAAHKLELYAHCTKTDCEHRPERGQR